MCLLFSIVNSLGWLAKSWSLDKYPDELPVTSSVYVGYGEQYTGITSTCSQFQVTDNGSNSNPYVSVYGQKIYSFSHTSTGTRSVNYSSQPNSFAGVQVTYSSEGILNSARVLIGGTCINR